MALMQVNVRGGKVYVAKQIEELDCVGCSGPHTTDACSQNTETVAFIKNDPYSNL